MKDPVKFHLLGAVILVVVAFMCGRISATESPEERKARAVAQAVAQIDDVQARFDRDVARIQAKYRDAGAFGE